MGQQTHTKRRKNLMKEARSIVESYPDTANEIGEDLWAIYEKIGTDLEEEYGRANRFKTLAAELQLMISDIQDDARLGEIVDVLTAIDVLKRWGSELQKKKESP